MTNPIRFLLLFIAGLAVCLGLALSSPATPAYAQSCDPSGSIDGTADPQVIMTAGQSITFTVSNFTPGEEISFWFTLPTGDVFGTASPLCCAEADGTVHFAPLPLPAAFFQFPGRWAFTAAGAQSQHQSIVYFCLGVAAQPEPTATTPPPPPTATSEPATATATAAPAPPTAEATATSAPVATSEPSAVVSSPTTAVAEPTSTTIAVATATTEVIPIAATAEPTPGSVGMPRTGVGGNDGLLYFGLAMIALGLLSMGLLARRGASNRR